MSLQVIWRIALVALLLVASTVTQATGLRDYLNGTQTLSRADENLLADLSKYYRMHGNVRLGREHRLDNGVAWRLLIDSRTGTAVPRITWMADRKSLVKANALFEALHGAALVDYDIEDLELRRQELYDGRPREPHHLVPEEVVVTYATPRIVSYLEVKRRFIGSTSVDVRGRVLDLERGEIRQVAGCRNSDDSTGFRLGEWLDVCGDAAYESFKALWIGKLSQAVTKARRQGADLSEEAGEIPETLRRYDERMALYLTPTGLAVLDKTWGGRKAFKNITVNPVVLPYRELEPFMKPGRWRDDVSNLDR